MPLWGTRKVPLITNSWLPEAAVISGLCDRVTGTVGLVVEVGVELATVPQEVRTNEPLRIRTMSRRRDMMRLLVTGRSAPLEDLVTEGLGQCH
jgi:hypothetical protein